MHGFCSGQKKQNYTHNIARKWRKNCCIIWNENMQTFSITNYCKDLTNFDCSVILQTPALLLELKFKWVKIKCNLKFGFPITLATFQLLDILIWEWHLMHWLTYHLAPCEHRREGTNISLTHSLPTPIYSIPVHGQHESVIPLPL